MLRRCIQGARRQRCRRQLSTLASSWGDGGDDDSGRRRQQPRHPPLMAGSVVGGHHHHYAAASIARRQFSISRRPDLARQGNAVEYDAEMVHEDAVPPGDESYGSYGGDEFVTADDMEYDELLGIDDGDVHGIRKGRGASGGEVDQLKEFWDDDDAAGGGDDIFSSSGYGYGDKDGDEPEEELDEHAKAEKAYRQRQKQITDDLENRTGRLWTDDWIITDEEWMADESFDDIEDWAPHNATRKSLESVRVAEGGVPTLLEMSRYNLPPSLPPHPGHGTPAKYAKFRKRQLRKKLRTAIQLSVAGDLRGIMKMNSWDAKQAAVDDLFETIEGRVGEREPILGQLPDFADMVEEGLEDVLKMVQGRMKRAERAEGDVEDEGGDGGDGSKEATEKGKGGDPEEIIDVMGVNEEEPVPIFMDVLLATRNLKKAASQESDDGDDKPSIPKFFSESNKDDVPNLIYPLNVHPKDGIGRMVEEWQLAANKETKRIMVRDAMREVASKVVEAARCRDGEAKEEDKGAARVFIGGKRGVGKTAMLAGLVASARMSGHIVVYLPDGDRLRKHGYYVVPCDRRRGLYNLPEIAKELCDELLTSHGEDVAALPHPHSVATREEMRAHFKDEQIPRAFRRAYADDESVTEEDRDAMTELSLDRLLRVGIGSSSLSSGCYNLVISKLKGQTSRPFTVVMDEFNCYYDHGHYFHMEYDEHVRRGIPPNRITVYKPFLDAVGLYPDEAGTDMSDQYAEKSSEAMMKWGSVIVGTSEGRAVRGSFTESLAAAARALSKDEEHPLHVVDLHRFSAVEVRHNLYNFEVTGIGRLRFDRGNTTLNPDEVEYLRLVSGGSGQQLMDACMLP